MDIYNIDDIRALLAKHGFRFSKSLGQNFLVDRSVPQRIAERSGADKSCGVVEIGPGIGSLTLRLSDAAAKVVAIELDRDLLPILDVTLSGCENVTVINADALNMDLSALVRERFGGLRPVLCANIPYNITSPLIGAIIKADCFESATLMIQREVARRICAAPGSPDYGSFTVFVNYFTEPEQLFDVPPSAFIPQPKVTSTVIRLHRREAPPCRPKSEELFFRVVRASFAQRRKLLLNGLFSVFSTELSKDDLKALLTACGFPDNVRGETLDIPAFARLSDMLYDKIKTP